MRSRGAALLAGVVLAALTVVGGSAPAGAALTVSSSGTLATVAMTGTTNAVLGCGPSGFFAAGVVASPPIACGTITSIIVAGDSGAQRVDARELSLAALPNLAQIDVVMGGGDDEYVESQFDDDVDMGSGADRVALFPFPQTDADQVFDLGGQPDDTADLQLSATDDTATITSTPTVLSIVHSTTAGNRTKQLRGVDALLVFGGHGNDVLNAAGADDFPTDRGIALLGDDGNDTLTASPLGSELDGSRGTNSLTGGAGSDLIRSESSTDTIALGGGSDTILDLYSRRSGRTISSTGSVPDGWGFTALGGDQHVRIRPQSGARAVMTTSLTRDGQQVLPTTFDRLGATIETIPTGPTRTQRSVIDLVPLTGATIQAGGNSTTDDIIDIYVPSGTWTATPYLGGSTNYTFSAGYGTVTTYNATVNVHGPFADANQRFVHKAIRDLQMRIASPAERDALRAQLNTGARTRTSVVRSLMQNDTYRGLDVDRSFLSFLRRTSDAPGRAYWVGRIRDGLSLRTFRANIFASSEYYTRFGGGSNAGWVNAAYVDVLGRAPDASGLAYWVGQLGAGVARSTVAGSFLSTSEARQAIVTEQFLRFVARTPTAAEVDRWVPVLGSSATGEQQMIESLAASATYFGLD